MGAEKDIIVAVELGSTAILAIAGKRQPDGSMRVLAIAQEDATNCIRKGIVDNIDKTTQTISNVIQRLNEKLNVHITKVYVGLSGQSLHTVLNKVEKNYDSKTQIGNEIVDQLKDINGATVYPDSKILDVVPDFGLERVGDKNSEGGRCPVFRVIRAHRPSRSAFLEYCCSQKPKREH